MTTVSTSAAGFVPSWDGEGRRVSGGPLVPDPPVPGDALTFGDILSVINPLQHIPIVSTVYRWLTGDTIKPAARAVGGALFGGPIGLATAAFNAVVEQVKGADLGEQVLAMVMPPAAGPAIAAAAPDAGVPPAPEQQAANAAALKQLAEDLGGPVREPSRPPQPGGAAVLPGDAKHGRTLAFYQANAGQRLVPLAGAPRLVQIPPPAGATDGAPKGSESGSAAAPEGPPSTWFAAAMMRGLDRYRASLHLGREPAPQLDLSH